MHLPVLLLETKTASIRSPSCSARHNGLEAQAPPRCFQKPREQSSASGIRCFGSLKPPQQHQDEQDQQNQAKPAARVVTPLSAVRPRGDCAQQHQNQNNDQNRSKHTIPLLFWRGSFRQLVQSRARIGTAPLIALSTAVHCMSAASSSFFARGLLDGHPVRYALHSGSITGPSYNCSNDADIPMSSLS